MLLVLQVPSPAAAQPSLPALQGKGAGGGIPKPNSDDSADAERPLAELLKALQSKDLKGRRKAASGLFLKSPPHDPAAIPALIEALRDKDLEVRVDIALALGKYGPQAKAAVPALLEIAKKKEDDARLSAVYVLGAIGPDAHEAVTNLVEMLAEKSSYSTREAGCESFGGNRPEGARGDESFAESDGRPCHFGARGCRRRPLADLGFGSGIGARTHRRTPGYRCP